MFPAMFDQAVSGIDHANMLMRERIDNGVVQSLLPLALDGARPISKGLFYECDYVSFGLVLISFGIFLSRCFFSHNRIDEVVVRSRGMKQLLGEATLRGRRLEVIFVFRKIFRH